MFLQIGNRESVDYAAQHQPQSGSAQSAQETYTGGFTDEQAEDIGVGGAQGLEQTN